MKTIVLLLLGPALSASAFTGEITFESSHQGNRLGGLQSIQLADGVLTARAPAGGTARLVLKSNAPMSIESASGATAALKPAWGSLGASLHTLDLTIPAAGDIVVNLHLQPPPTAPQATSAEEQAAFEKALAARKSRPADTPEAFKKWHARYKRDLAKWLMNGRLPKRVPSEARVVQTWEDTYPQFTLTKVEYKSHKDRSNTLLLSMPRNASRVPLLLVLHGHEAPWGEADPAAYRMGHNDEFCAYFAERGWAVLQPATMDHQLQHEGWTLQGEWTWDAMVALDYALAQPQIDKDRIAVCGLSTGGHLAMDVLALDDRIKASVVGCVLSTWNHYRKRVRFPPHCDCGILDQLGPHLEQCDWAAIAAPKPVQFQHGRQDAALGPGADPKFLTLNANTGILPMAEFEAAFNEVKRAYRLAGKPENVELAIHDAGHRVNNESAYRWLCRALGVEQKPGPATSSDGDVKLDARTWQTLVVGRLSTPERYAITDLCRYITQVTGRPPAVQSVADWRAAPAPAIVLGTPAGNTLIDAELASESLGDEGYTFSSLPGLGRPTLVGAARTPAGVVNAVYGLLRQAGFGFYLGSEAIPEHLPDRLPASACTAKPSLAIRGVLPWYNFFNSPTVWDPIDHRTFVDQLIRCGANFVGFHTYDAEPFAAYDDGGRMKLGARLLNTRSPTWGTSPLPTRQFAFGTDLLFADDYFGAKTSLAGGNDNDAIRREQSVLREALEYARQRGLHTCLGFEITGDPTSPGVRDVFLRRLNHVLDQYPALDYIWLWQAETQGTTGYREWFNRPQSSDADRADDALYLYGHARRQTFKRVVDRKTGEKPFFQDTEEGRLARAIEGARLEQFAMLACRAMGRRAHPPRLVISGWGGDERLLSAEYYAGLDTLLPRDVVFASLDHIVPRPRVDRIYHELSPGRQRWPIPWLEYDGDQWHAQAFVHVYEPMLRDILAGGSQGVLGIHWRTRNVEENFAYLVAGAWQPDLTAEGFYADLAARCYPAAIADKMASIHSRLDQLGYRWIGGGGQIECGGFSWSPGEPAKVKQLESICAEIVALKPQAGRSAGRLQWLLAHIEWTLAFDQAQRAAMRASELLAEAQVIAGGGGQGDPAPRAAEALGLLDNGAMPRALRTYAVAVSTRGEHGVLATINTKAVVAWRDLREQCGKLLGKPLPAEADAWKPARQILLPRLIGSIRAGRALELQPVVLGGGPAFLHYRTLGETRWKQVQLEDGPGWTKRGVVPAEDVVSPGIDLVLSLSPKREANEGGLSCAITVMPATQETSAAPAMRTADAVPADFRLSTAAGGPEHMPVELTWDPFPQVDYFRVLRNGVEAAWTAVPFFADAPRMATVTYQVEAWRDGRVIARSKQATCATADRPVPAPTDLRAVAGTAEVLLYWADSGPNAALTYRVYRLSAADRPAAPKMLATVQATRWGGRAYKDTPPAGKWVYRLAGVNVAGREGPASEVSVEFVPGRRPKPALDEPLTHLPPGAEVVGRIGFGPDGANLSNGYMKYANRPEWDMGGPFTLAFEFRANSIANIPVLVSHGAWTIDGWFVQILGGSLIVRTPAADAQGPTIEPGRWYAVRLVYDGAVLHLFVDGKHVSQSGGGVRIPPADRALIIGQYDAPGPLYAFQGTLRNLVIRNEAVLP